MKNKGALQAAAILGALAVVFGALGAHALERYLNTDALESFETGVRYQMYHALALLVMGLSNAELKYGKIIASLWIIGVVLFSGSIYLLSTQSLTDLNWSWLGPITPVGGLLLIAAWVLLFMSSLRSSKKN